MKALVFAAGLGTRLRPLTDTLPKALVPLGNGTLLSHTLLKLKSSGISEAVVNVFHFADKIIDYLKENGSFGMGVSISDERAVLDPPSPLETGGGILHARELLLPEGSHSDDEPFLVHNVDIVSNLDIASFISSLEPDSETLATILVSTRKTSRYLLFDAEMRLVGWENVSTGQVKTPYRDLETGGLRRLAFSGIHLISPRIFQVMDEIGTDPGKYPLYDGGGQIIDDSPLGIKFSITDFYLRAASCWQIMGVTVPCLEIIDVGKPETLALAEEKLSKTKII